MGREQKQERQEAKVKAGCARPWGHKDQGLRGILSQPGKPYLRGTDERQAQCAQL